MHGAGAGVGGRVPGGKPVAVALWLAYTPNLPAFSGFCAAWAEKTQAFTETAPEVVGIAVVVVIAVVTDLQDDGFAGLVLSVELNPEVVIQIIAVALKPEVFPANTDVLDTQKAGIQIDGIGGIQWLQGDAGVSDRLFFKKVKTQVEINMLDVNFLYAGCLSERQGRRLRRKRE